MIMMMIMMIIIDQTQAPGQPQPARGRYPVLRKLRQQHLHQQEDKQQVHKCLLQRQKSRDRGQGGLHHAGFRHSLERFRDEL